MRRTAPRRTLAALLVVIVLGQVSPGTAAADSMACSHAGRLTGPRSDVCSSLIEAGFYSFKFDWAPQTTADLYMVVDDGSEWGPVVYGVCVVRVGYGDHCYFEYSTGLRYDDMEWNGGPLTGRVEIRKSSRVDFWVEPPDCATTCALPAIHYGSADFSLSETGPF